MTGEPTRAPRELLRIVNGTVWRHARVAAGILTLFMAPTAVTGQSPVSRVAQVAKRASPAVVIIEGRSPTGSVQGSGFVVAADGKVVTNLHVVRDLISARVRVPNGDVFDAISVLASDERRDLVVLKVAGYGLPVLALGDSGTVTIGEPVAVVGSPLGLSGTVTAGILSAVRDSGDGFKVLQTDAATNPGNSGGPLLNGQGRAIGVVSFQLRSSQGLNFAVPINYVRGLLENLHEPTTLDQMRAELSARPTSSSTAGPSLQETLAWLRENIVLATRHYVAKVPDFLQGTIGPTEEITLRTFPTQVDSCTVVIEDTETSVWAKYGRPITKRSRQTVALGRIVDVNSTFAPAQGWKDVDAWPVFLDAESKVVLVEDFDTDNVLTKSQTKKSAIVLFFEEPLANRVVAAFTHAAALCRNKEPF